MISTLFHAWERRLASVSDGDRVVRAFEWGLDWIPPNGHDPAMAPDVRLDAWVGDILTDSERLFHVPDTSQYRLVAGGWGSDDLLTFPSALETPHPENNLVHARYIPARRAYGRKPRRAVLVLPQ